MKKLVFLILFLCISEWLLAQQQAIFSQYMFNGIAINPAYTGSQEVPYFTAVNKFSSLGVAGGPTTRSLSVHSPLKSKVAAIGLLVVNDKIAVSNQTGTYFTYSYSIPFDIGKLSFGLQGGMTTNRTDFYRLSIQHEGIAGDGTGASSDPSFASGEARKALFNFGAGVLFSSTKYYLGISLPFLMKNRISEEVSSQSVDQVRHLFINGGYFYDLGPNVRIRPSFLFKKATYSEAQYDLSLSALLINRIWVGASYRSTNYFIPFMEVQLNEDLSFGYSYDMPMNNTLGLTSHELLLTYRITREKKLMTSPRMF